MFKNCACKTFFLLLVCLLATHYGYAMEEAVKTKDETFERKLVVLLNEYSHSFLPKECIEDLEKLSKPTPVTMPLDAATIFKYFPKFTQVFAYKALNAGRAQSLFRAQEVGRLIGANNLYIKHDTTARKLEFLFGDALSHQCSAIMTFGAPGSEHAIEVAFWAKLFKKQAICMLRGEEEYYPDRDAAYVRHVLLRHLKNGSKLRYTPTQSLNRIATADEFSLVKIRSGFYPYPIPAGGSNPLGFLGLINAMFDLKEQIAKGEVPKPDFIITRTGANAAGLLFGIKAAKIESQLLAFEMRPEEHPSKLFNHVKSRFPAINALLKQADPQIPNFDFSEQDFEVITGLGIGDYVAAAQKLQEDPYFANKPLLYVRSWAALADYIKLHKLQNKNILVLDDFSAKDDPELAQLNWRELPKELHFYFEEPIKPS